MSETLEKGGVCAVCVSGISDVSDASSAESADAMDDLLAESSDAADESAKVRSLILVPAKSPEPNSEQKMQPPVPAVPSRFGQVKPPSIETFEILIPNRSFSHGPIPL